MFEEISPNSHMDFPWQKENSVRTSLNEYKKKYGGFYYTRQLMKRGEVFVRVYRLS